MATQKQQKAAEYLAGNGGSVSSAMRAAGYSQSTTHTPSKLTASKGFKQLLEQSGRVSDLVGELFSWFENR